MRLIGNFFSISPKVSILYADDDCRKAEADKLENKTDKSGIKRNFGLLYLHYYLPFCMSALYIFQCLVGLVKWKYFIHYRNNCSRFYK